VAAESALTVISPPPSSLHYTSPADPAPITLLVRIDLDLEDFRGFLGSSESDIADVRLLVELDRLDSTTGGEYEPGYWMEVEKVRELAEGWVRG
jgi:hypothetical protein